MKNHFIRVAQVLGIGIMVLAMAQESYVVGAFGSVLLVVSIVSELVVRNNVFKLVQAIFENTFLTVAPSLFFYKGEQLVQMLCVSYITGIIWFALILFEESAIKEKLK